MENAKFLVDGLLDYCGIEREDTADSEKILLSIDDETAVFLALEGSLVHLSSVLDEAPDSKDFYFSLLTENFTNATDTGYYRYAIEPDSRSIIISLSINTDGLGQTEFIDYFKLFLENSEKWTAALNRQTPEIPDGQDDAGTMQPDPSDMLHRV